MFRWHRSSQLIGATLLLSIIGFLTGLTALMLIRSHVSGTGTLEAEFNTYAKLDRVIASVSACLSAIGLFSGLVTLHQHQHYFSKFHVCHIAALRMDAWLYIIVTISTALCAGSSIVQLYEVVSLPSSPQVGFLPYLTECLRCGVAAVVVGMHMVINALLANPEICRICQRTWDNHGKAR